MLEYNQEEQELVRKGSSYKAFKDSPAYKYILEFLQEFCNESLRMLEEASENLPDEVVIRRVMGWREREALFQSFQNEVNKTVDMFRQWTEENLPREELEKLRMMEESYGNRKSEIPRGDDA